MADAVTFNIEEVIYDIAAGGDTECSQHRGDQLGRVVIASGKVCADPDAERGEKAIETADNAEYGGQGGHVKR